MGGDAVRRSWWRLRARWRRVPLRTRVAVLMGVIAVTGLVWQHHTHTEQAGRRPAPPPVTSGATTPANPAQLGPAPPGDGGVDSSVGQSDPATIVPDASVDAARATAQRFAANFASPNGNFDDWLARISADLSAQLKEQYRLTDIRNVTQATVVTVSGPVNQLPGTMAFQVTYSDGSRIEIRVEMGVEGWKVINVLPLNSTPTAPPPAPATPTPAGGAEDGQ